MEFTGKKRRPTVKEMITRPFYYKPIISPDGKKKIEVKGEGDPENAEEIGTNAAETLIKYGADMILNSK